MNEKTLTNDPKTQPRVRVVSVNGSPLSPALPSSVRRMVETGAAQIVNDPLNGPYAQMTREVGMTIPHD